MARTDKTAIMTRTQNPIEGTLFVVKGATGPPPEAVGIRALILKATHYGILCPNMYIHPE